MKKIFLTLTIMSLLCFSQQSFSNETTTENTINSLTEQANQGDIYAQYNLGVMYAKGEGVPQDNQKAFEYYDKAAKQNNEKAQYNLGVMYYIGQGVPQDYLKAIEYFSLAANQDYADAQYNLGLMYYNGKGIPQNTPKAKSLFKQGCLNKNQKSCNEYSKLNR